MHRSSSISLRTGVRFNRAPSLTLAVLPDTTVIAYDPFASVRWLLALFARTAFCPACLFPIFLHNDPLSFDSGSCPHLPPLAATCDLVGHLVTAQSSYQVIGGGRQGGLRDQDSMQRDPRRRRRADQTEPL